MSRRHGGAQRPTLAEFSKYLTQGYYGSELELRSDSLYDIQTCGPESSEVHFFQNPVGGKTILGAFCADRRHYDRTNMYLPGSLPPPQRMLVDAIRIEVYCDGGARERERAYGMVYAHGYLQFLIGSHVQHQGARLGSYMGFGYPLDFGALIEPAQNFAVSLFWPEIKLRKHVDIGVYLDGTRVFARA